MKNIKDIRINIPKYPKLIIDTLEKNGYEAYIVGGCVRDSILDNNPSDYDITTNAKPNTIKELFKRTIDTGIKHGTVTVLFYEDNKPFTYEVTTYRVDGEYDDARHPKDVKFVSDLKEDLLRRDFTINAMAYNDKSGLVDEFGGLVDLEKRIIRAVGDPIKRFTEDALRLLRAVRFSAKLGFEIDNETEDAIRKLSENLKYVSKERVQVELTKTITSANPEYISKVFELGLSKYICDGFESISCGRFEKYLPTHMAYACLLYNADVDIANKILKELKLDNNNISKIIALLNAKNIYNTIKEFYNSKKRIDEMMAIKSLINYLNYDLTYEFLKLLHINGEDKVLLDRVCEFVNEYNNSKAPIFIRDLLINGNELMDIGFKGLEIGVTLGALLKIVHKNRAYNDKKVLQEIAKKAYNYYKGGVI